MKKFVLISFVLSLLSTGAVAQSASDKAQTGSIYSKIGVGFPVDHTSSSADGMGALGVSFNETNVPGLANPALWGVMPCLSGESGGCFGTATGGFSLEHFDGSDTGGNVQSSVFSANHFQLQLPIVRNKLGISAAVTPLTRSNYRVLNQQEVPMGTGSNTETVAASVQNIGSGGISSLELGFGMKINDNLSLGYAGSLVLASLENNITTVFESADFQTVEYTLRTSGTGFGNRFGALVTLPDLLGQQDYLRIGAAVNLPVTINGERQQEADKTISTNNIETITRTDGEGLGDGELKLPMEYSGGITYHLNPTLSFTAEGKYAQWSEYSSSFGSTLLTDNRLSDRYKTVFGIRYFPFTSGSNTFLSRFKYRAGVSYDTGHLKIDGHQIETILFSAGLGIPSPRSNSSIDINFHYGIRGTHAQNLVKESIWGLKLSINLAELMFYQPKLQ